MALSVASSSNTNSAPIRKWKYEVFLSFRGEDTRFGFTDHLYTGLKNKGIVTFRDKEGLGRGEVISQELLKAIEESLCAVVILSENYASSTWCLDELKKILESKLKLGQQVLPVFYGVEPSDIRNQKGNFAKAFKTHERRFKGDKEKVRSWRAALTEVAGLSGLTSINCYETDLIENIAETVCAKLLPKLSFSFDGLVGIGSEVAEMKSLLEMGLDDDVCFVGIWGMGGVGKTTLASVVYEGIRNEFEISCFVANVREVSEKYDLAYLQKELLSPLKHRNFVIKNEYEGREKIRHFLCHMKVLLVLDDVSDKSQLDNLAGKQEWFGKGSRVIITTRDKHLLTPKRLFKNYDIEMLNSDESLQLFSENAFNKNQPEADYLELSKAILKYCGGLPLALKVLGSFLCERSISEWQDALNRMEQNTGDDVILKTLQISYNGLSRGDRAIFLDIACFFNNMEENMLRTFLKDCGLNSILGLNMLVEKSMVSYDKTRIQMHDLLVQLGKSTVLDESPNDAGKRSRLWSQKEIDKVLGRNEGAKEIQGIVFTSPKPYQPEWHEDCFSEMKGLRLLVLQNVHLLHVLKSLPSALKVLVWEGYALNALPHIAQSNDLVSLMLPRSKLSQLWNSTQFLRELRVMDLRHSKDLTITPEFDRIPNLESLILEGCESLDQVHESLGKHKKLVKVDFTGCKNLVALPSKLCMNSLETFILTGCSKLEKLPEFGENMHSLSMLHLENTAVAELPPSLGFLTGLSELNLKGCKNLVSFPNTMCNLKSFRILNISLCSLIERFPENLNENVHYLEELHAGATAITEIPSYIIDFKNLKVLSFQQCKGREFISSSLPLPLPRSFSGLSLLTELDLAYCDLRDESIPDDFNCLSSLWKLNLMGNHFVNLPVGCISNLLKLQQLNLSACLRLQSLPQLPPKLQQLFATHCYSMKPLLDQQLWNLFASHHFQNYSTPNISEDFIFLMHGDEIPSWFLNKSYHCEDSVQSICNKSISITMEIPHGSPEWSGIAVCLVLEELLPHSMCLRSIYWYFKSPEHEGYKGRTFFRFYDGSDNSKLFIAFFPFTNVNCWQHLRGGLNQQLQLAMYSKTETSLTGAPLSPSEEDGVLGIRDCGWRLLCKQDFETCCKTMGDCNASTSASAEIEIISSNDLNNQRVTEVSNENKQCQDELEGQYPNQTEAPKSFFRTCFTIFMTCVTRICMVSDENENVLPLTYIMRGPEFFNEDFLGASKICYSSSEN